MHKWFISVFALVAGAGVIAQTKQTEPQPDPAREQWRLELRTVLQAQRNPDRMPVSDQTPAGRQLTPKEHAELRQQLRELRAEKPASP